MKRNKPLISFIHFINTYSVLVALGSFSCYLFFSKFYQVQVNIHVALGLAIGVWVIYTLDHLLDGIQLKEKALAIRHKTHFQNQKQISIVLFLSCIFLLILAFKIPSKYYNAVGVLLVASVFHFLINYLLPVNLKRILFLKEVFIAIVVTVGFAFVPLLEVDWYFHFSTYYPVFTTLFFLNLANLMLFSYYDKSIDKETDTLSIAGFYSNKALKIFIYSALAISMGLSVYLFINGADLVRIAPLLSMQLTLALVCHFDSVFRKHDRYRFYGDLIYVYPLVAMPFLS